MSEIFRPAVRRLSWLLLAVLAGCETATAPATRPGIPATPVLAATSTIPAEGTSSTLDFGTWNIEWFGYASEGPSNEALQLENVRDVIAMTDLDVWGVQEVVDTTHFRSLVNQLTGYAGFLASDALVTDGPAYYSGYDGTEQKVGFVYKTAVAQLRSARIILTAYDYEFAGRPPLEATFAMSLNGTTEDVTVIVLHAKAGTGGGDYDRRLKASQALKDYLDTYHATGKVLVIGDFNDDVDKSIVRPKASPYANFVNDSADYRFPTKALSDAGISSTVNYSDMIDHHLGTNEYWATYVASSARVLRVDQYIDSYEQTTSDHYPVATRYTMASQGGNTSPVAAFTVSCTDLACAFTDGSSDADGTIAAWAWAFGDGTTSVVQHPAHTYAVAGSYTVSLTVTDDQGATAKTTKTVSVGSAGSPGITLGVSGRKASGKLYADLKWSGATSADVDVYRDGSRITTTPNDGAHSDNLGRASGTYTYKVCEAGTATCSNEATLTITS